MSEEKSIKFTDDELKQLKEIQAQYGSVQIKFGQLGFAKMRIEKEIDNINKSESEVKNEFSEIQDNEEKFIKEIPKKYGEGVLDTNTGIFNLNK